MRKIKEHKDQCNTFARSEEVKKPERLAQGMFRQLALVKIGHARGTGKKIVARRLFSQLPPVLVKEWTHKSIVSLLQRDVWHLLPIKHYKGFVSVLQQSLLKLCRYIKFIS